MSRDGKLILSKEWEAATAARYEAIRRIAALDTVGRLKAVFTLMLPMLPEKLKETFTELLKPKNLALFAGFAVAGAVAGASVAPLLAAFGYALLGSDALDISRALYIGIRGALEAQTPEDLARAAGDLAQGLSHAAGSGTMAAAGAVTGDWPKG